MKEYIYKSRASRTHCLKCGKLGVEVKVPNPEYRQWFHKYTVDDVYGLKVPTITQSCSFKVSDYEMPNLQR